ncbi:hypothetical protein RKD26_003595 [Streptomyces calvus]
MVQRGEGAARFEIVGVDDEGVPVGLREADPSTGPGGATQFREYVCGLGHVHEDAVDLGAVHAVRLHGQRVRVALAEFHPRQPFRARPRLRQHGRIPVHTDHTAPVTHAFRQRRQIRARPAPDIQGRLTCLDIQQLQKPPLVRAARFGGGGPQHVRGLIGLRHTERRGHAGQSTTVRCRTEGAYLPTSGPYH